MRNMKNTNKITIFSILIAIFALVGFASFGQVVEAATPTVTTISAINITSTTADLRATYDDNGSPLTFFQFQYGITANGLTLTATPTLPGAGSGTVVYTISGLTPSESYSFRIMGANANGPEIV